VIAIEPGTTTASPPTAAIASTTGTPAIPSFAPVFSRFAGHAGDLLSAGQPPCSHQAQRHRDQQQRQQRRARQITSQSSFFSIPTVSITTPPGRPAPPVRQTLQSPG
jgi:hypothetical protein